VLAAIELGALVEAAWVSFLAGVVVTAAFALVVRQSGRSSEARRAGNGGAAALHAVIGMVFFAAFATIVVVGLVIMLRK
jgi:hypothetical protein